MDVQRRQRQLLEAIENELRDTDPGLALVFMAFASLTRAGAMPPAEQLGPGAGWQAGSEHGR
jgi:hypothetical protein